MCAGLSALAVLAWWPVSAGGASAPVSPGTVDQTPQGSARPRVTVETTDGRQLSGRRLNGSTTELQLLVDGGGADDAPTIRLLRAAGERYRVVISDTDWPTYNGDVRGNRFSNLDQIDPSSVSRLTPSWVFPVAGGRRLQVTPVVVDGVMYVTDANEAYALDAGSGRELWSYRRPRTEGLVGDASVGINRGVAVAGRRLFMITDHAHLIALDRFTGTLLWETEMADWQQNYGATSAPLVVGDLVVSGTSGGDEGVRGFLAAFDLADGREVWRFWTVPARGEPGSETWSGSAIDHPCAATWLTGTYDPDLDLLYWPTGNPCPDYDGAERQGDNLYSDSVLALERSTGELRWHYQYTPHDLWDWDAQQPPVLVDREWKGAPRRLLLHANRNGFFYVLDRTDGELLLAEPFVEKLTWASGIGADGRPVLNPDQTPSAEGTTVCPAVQGATNWFSTSFHPETGLYYVQTLEHCNVFTRTPEEWEAGRSYYGGSTRSVRDEPPQKILRAIDIATGEIAWALPQVGPANSWGGTLATAGGLVFFGEDSGAFAAVDAATGEPLWSFPTNAVWKASPMTYMFDGRQHVAVAAGPNILSFALGSEP
ncbi:MAG TPA: PQQ-dependent dehydrogenase, methanol/ethanol family [Acidobacteria bacterium]|jgi:alcohol dehydrogenase (cytochrome c)|nr:PQQ-dependent dehydrogenase, methanol/ethanol family [Acidobacteriota bacterium]HAK56736.1 PQQ-dependent dehydrogenase, methanol/ethanol family [Acidobacteriota bacterium]|tara:strand:- start:24764 stop:26554 length:1791 start_codon:yes stop_codon:yes gene_type:complete